MNTQPEALRLADELFDGVVFGGVSIELAREAQNELRRLHEVNRMLVEAAEMALDYIEQALQLHDQQYQRHPSTEKDRQAIVDDLETLRQALAQTEQRPVGTYEGVMETMLSLQKGTFEQQQIYTHMKDKFLYTAPVDAVNMSQECVDETAKCKHEPVAWQDPQYKTLIEPHKAHPDWIPLYTAPPKRGWVGLTKDEVDSWELPDTPTVFEFAQFIEAKLKERNT